MRLSLQTLTLACVIATAGVTAHAEEHGGHGWHAAPRDGRGFVLDGRYNHGHYYPEFGAQVRVLPDGYRPYYWRGSPYYCYGGVWYAPGAAGFVVVRPPIGLTVAVLPPYYSTLWFGGVPYYYANNVYYNWTPGGYVVVDPPANADEPGAPPPPQTHGAEDLIVYPKNGQTREQQAADDFECHNWAKSQSGFDPSDPNGGGAAGRQRSGYDRAKGACMQARGYEVR